MSRTRMPTLLHTTTARWPPLRGLRTLMCPLRSFSPIVDYGDVPRPSLVFIVCSLYVPLLWPHPRRGVPPRLRLRRGAAGQSGAANRAATR